MDTERDYPRYVQELSQHISEPQLPLLLRQSLYSQLHPDCESITNIPTHDLPYITTKIDVFHSAVARFYAPSDLCGAGGMRRERIRSTPSWYGCPRRDTVLINIGGDPSVMKGMNIGRVFLFMAFNYDGITYPCALIQWLVPASDAVDDETGMWIVEPEYLDNGDSDSELASEPHLSVIHIDSLVRAAHLIPVFGDSTIVPEYHELEPSETLNNFMLFYVNKFIDYHAHEIAF